jgi:hypothetical protein
MQNGRKRPAHRVWSTTLLTCAAVALVGGLSACQTGSTSANGGNPPPAVTDATISFCDDGTASCTPATSFNVDTLRDLVVNVNWEKLSAGSHTQMIEVLMPEGGLYQGGQSAFLVPDSSNGSLKTTRTVPVAATWISQRHITGEWSVRVSLDGKAITTQTVQLNP